jgi:anti-anti-sigma regulatory factor
MSTIHPVELLRFNTCGSVDDGKSTLIGRLLYDTKSLMEDQIEALERSADITGGGQINLANLTDGLRAEREQGITIDVAYRYFATPRRKFIVADTPGHIQYTRNMVTGASTANLSVILVDARHGVIEQTRRHTCIAALLGIPHLVVAVNIGVILATLHFLRRMADSVEVRPASLEDLSPELARHGLAELPRDTLVYTIDGPFFFGAVENFERALAAADGDPQTLVFYLRWVPFIDITGLQTLEEVIRSFRARGVRVLLAGANARVQAKLTRAGVLPLVETAASFPTLGEALRFAAAAKA